MWFNQTKFFWKKKVFFIYNIFFNKINLVWGVQDRTFDVKKNLFLLKVKSFQKKNLLYSINVCNEITKIDFFSQNCFNVIFITKDKLKFCKKKSSNFKNNEISVHVKKNL